MILDLESLHKHKIVVDFSSNPIKTSTPDASNLNLQDFTSLHDAVKKNKGKIIMCNRST